MHIKSVEVRKFRRFQKLNIGNLPETAKLVVLTGPNGCGKSSLFDAFSIWYHHHRDWGDITPDYHFKDASGTTWNDHVVIDMHEPIPPDLNTRKKMFYTRSAYRNEPEFTVSGFGNSQSLLDDGRRVRKMIDNDVHVADNYQRLVSKTVQLLYDPSSDEMKGRELREALIGQVRESMKGVFPDLLLTSVGSPTEQGTFFFEKGTSRDFRYKNLSGGEKAAFDILLDFIIKKSAYDDTIYCIDEPELHINTRTQARLLEELFSLIPERCQLWISTHSIGMMRAAKRLRDQQPDAVVFLDFDGKDFDQDCVMTPTAPDRAYWRRLLNVALDDLAGLIAPDQVFLCEGRPVGSVGKESKAEVDAACYRRIFAAEFPGCDFISVGNASDVQSDRLDMGKTIQTLVPDTKITRLIDRDDRSPDEVQALQKEGVKVLKLRHLEAYLYSEEILTALCHSEGKPEAVAEVLQARAKAIADSVNRGNQPDDVKSAKGDIHANTRRILKLTNAGSNPDVFAKEKLAPLVTQMTRTYRELKEIVFYS